MVESKPAINKFTVLVVGGREELRREMTPAEKTAQRVAGSPREEVGSRFRRQQIFAGFIVDFYCHKVALVVEVDGDIHDLQKEEDGRREKVLTEMGLRIVRFGNDEVARNVEVFILHPRSSGGKKYCAIWAEDRQILE